MRTKNLLLTVLYASLALFLVVPCAFGAAKDSKNVQILLILDASATMGDAMENTTRMAVAKQALSQIIDQLKSNPSVLLGLRIYGNRTGDCNDTTLEFPIQSIAGGNADAIKKKIVETEPNGSTPIAYSLLQCIPDFTGKGKKVVILVTDGIETCGGKPCDAAKELLKAGITIHVVGLGMSGTDLDTLKCIVGPSGGIITGANTSADFVNSMGKIIKKAVKAQAGF